MKRTGLHRLNEFPSHKGGDTCLYGRYVWEFCPGHPLQNSWGWVAQHRLVAETMLGRRLIQSEDPAVAEVVHHRNRNPTDNRPENLEVMSEAHHRKMHARQNADARLLPITTEMVRSALQGRTIREAAGYLGTTHMTLRLRFPDLIADRKRRAPADVNDPKWPGLIRPLAADPRCSLRDAVRLLGISAVPIRRICEREGITWMQNASRKEGGYGRPKGSKVLNVKDPKWPALVRPLADDPKCTMKEAARRLGIGESQLRNIRAYFGIPWVLDIRERMSRTGRGEAATLPASAPCASPTAPARKPRMAKKLVS